MKAPFWHRMWTWMLPTLVKATQSLQLSYVHVPFCVLLALLQPSSTIYKLMNEVLTGQRIPCDTILLQTLAPRLWSLLDHRTRGMGQLFPLQCLPAVINVVNLNKYVRNTVLTPSLLVHACKTRLSNERRHMAYKWHHRGVSRPKTIWFADDKYDSPVLCFIAYKTNYYVSFYLRLVGCQVGQAFPKRP